MFELVGILESVNQDGIGGNWVSDYTEERIAIFTSRELAQEYVNRSRLVRPRRGWCVTYPFRRRSLLYHYTHAEICGYSPEASLPVNPRFYND